MIRVFNTMPRRICYRILTLLAMISAAPLAAETVIYGDTEIHYSIFNTSFLQPQVAEAYDIVRAKDRALINIAVRRKLENNATEASAATITGTVNDLIHRRDLQFIEIREQGAIYYLAEMKFINQETLYFDISVQPNAMETPHKLEFRHTFYRD